MKHESHSTDWLAYALLGIGLALMIVFARAAVAAPVIVTWTNPTQRTDGTVFPSTQIQQTDVEWGSCASGAFGVTIGSGTAQGAVTNFTTPALPASEYCFRAFTVDTGGIKSAASNVVAKTVITAPPKPPVLTTVAVTAYISRGPTGKAQFWAVGTVPLGTECGAQHAGNNLYATIPAEAVTVTWGGYKGQQLYGVCA